MINLLCMFSLAAGVVVSTPTGDTTTEITALERDFYTAFLEQDADRMEELFADNFLYQHGSGIDFDEAAFVDLIASRTAIVTRADTPDLRMVDLGESVIASGESRVEGEIAGEPFGGVLRFVNVWHHDGARWQLVHRNSEFVAREEPRASR